jgi:hypothetical protein
LERVPPLNIVRLFRLCWSLEDARWLRQWLRQWLRVYRSIATFSILLVLFVWFWLYQRFPWQRNLVSS